MARTLNRLTAREVATATQPGMYADGAGLYLRVARSGARSWCLRFMLEGRAREMGLGGLSKLSLADARRKAAEHRLLLVDKTDPIDKRKAERAAKRIETARSMTFDDCARAYVDAHRPAWRHVKHSQQWTNSLARHVSPVLGALPVHTIDTALVMKVVEPLWATKPETASRIRGRIEVVLDWARVRGYRAGENPARWRGHLDHLLPARSKVRKVKHYRALPYTDMGAFMAHLRSRPGVGASALAFLIFTAARSSEVADARWAEIDRTARMWVVPAERMKGGREHRVPLSAAAIAILDRMSPTHDEFIFSNEPGRRLGKGALAKQLKGWNGTVHGFRSSFRDWAAERTSFPREVVESALAHAIEDRTEAAYRRTDLLEKRRQLMEAWTTFCTAPEQKPNVTSLPIKACVLRHGGEGNAPNAAAQQPCCRCDFTVSQAEARNDGGKYHSRFDERAVERIRASLPKGIDQRRVDLLPRVLNEWSRTDLTEHLSRDTPAASRKRFAQLTNVGKYATHLRQALEAIDQPGKSWIAYEIGREEGSPPFSVSRERHAEMKERLRQEDDFLRKFAAATLTLIEEDKRGRGQPRNIRAYLVMLDLAAIFEWLTDRKAARGVDRTDHTETGPFWRFAESVWLVAFGTTRGLTAAMKNWAKARNVYHGHSSFLLNLPMRRPEWGIYER